MQANSIQNNGSQDFLTLKYHYDGVGVNDLDIVKADKTLYSILYTEDRNPHMWWRELERISNEAFTMYNRSERRVLNSKTMKLRILYQKVMADFIQHSKASINIEPAIPSITITYQEALTSFWNQVNIKYPPEVSLS